MPDVDAPHARPYHRLRCIYGVRDLQAPDDAEPYAPAEALDLGRFARHFELADGTTRLLGHGERPGTTIVWGQRKPQVTIRALRGYVLAVPHAEPVVALELDFESELAEAVRLLAATCFDRDELKLAGGDSLVDGLVALVPGSPKGLEFGHDVHQILSPAGGDDTLLLSGAPRLPDLAQAAHFVYRDVEDYRIEYAAMKAPKELNRPPKSVAAHARGVTVLAGNAEAVENAAFLIAAQLLAANATLRDIRARSIVALGELDRAGKERVKLAARRDLVARLGTELSRLQIALSLGVEENMNPLHLPEVVLEHYQASLADSLGLATGAEVTSRMHDRLSTALAATAGSVTAIEQSRDNGRRQRWALAVGWLTTAAIPLTLTLAFFGVNTNEVHNGTRMLSLHHGYAWFYGLLAVLLLISFVGFITLWALGARQTRRLEKTSFNPPASVGSSPGS